MREYCDDAHFVCFEAHVLAKKQFSCKLVFIKPWARSPKHTACGPHMAREDSREFLYNQDLSHSVYSPVFGSSRPASEQAPFERTQRRLETVCL